MSVKYILIKDIPITDFLGIIFPIHTRMCLQKINCWWNIFSSQSVLIPGGCKSSYQIEHKIGNNYNQHCYQGRIYCHNPTQPQHCTWAKIGGHMDIQMLWIMLGRLVTVWFLLKTPKNMCVSILVLRPSSQNVIFSSKKN